MTRILIADDLASSICLSEYIFKGNGFEGTSAKKTVRKPLLQPKKIPPALSSPISS